MLVLKLTQIGPHILAACSNGFIYLWTLPNTISKEKPHALFSQTRQLFVTKDIISMQSLQSKAVVFSKYAIYVIDVNLITCEFCNQIVHPIFRSQRQSITASALLNDNQVFIGGSRGNVYRYDFISKIHTKVSRIQKHRQISNNFDFFVNPPNPQPQITSLAFDKQNSVFAGYQNGLIVAYNIKSCKQQENYNYSHMLQSETQEKEAVVEIRLKTQQNKIYSVHQSFILIWDKNSRIILLLIQIYRPVSIIFLKDQSNLILNQSSKLTFIRLNPNNVIATVSHTSRLGVCSIIYNYQGKEYSVVGGISGVIDIFETTTLRVTCFIKSQNNS